MWQQKVKSASRLCLRVREPLLNCLWRVEPDQGGQGLVEYALVLVLIAVVVLIVLGMIGKNVIDLFSNISSGLKS
jgi:pilus assembly protein Flp/PilA